MMQEFNSNEVREVSNFAVVMPAHELRPGTKQLHEVNGVQILVCRIADQVHALENRCSHQDMPLDKARLIGNRLTCPYHGGEFDVRTGAPTCFPASRPLRLFPARVHNGMIEVAVPAAAPDA